MKTIKLIDTKKLNNNKPTYKKMIKDLDIIRDKIYHIMRKHIGEENNITHLDLFSKVYDTDPLKVEYYKRYFLWNIIKKMISTMRRENEIFIINKRSYLFVLKNENECKKYQSFLQSNIKGLKKSQRKAQDWVVNKRWKNL